MPSLHGSTSHLVFVVSKGDSFLKSEYPKSSISIGFSIVNHPLLGCPHCRKPPCGYHRPMIPGMHIQRAPWTGVSFVRIWEAPILGFLNPCQHPTLAFRHRYQLEAGYGSRTKGNIPPIHIKTPKLPKTCVPHSFWNGTHIVDTDIRKNFAPALALSSDPAFSWHAHAVQSNGETLRFCKRPNKGCDALRHLWPLSYSIARNCRDIRPNI